MRRALAMAALVAVPALAGCGSDEAAPVPAASPPASPQPPSQPVEPPAPVETAQPAPAPPPAEPSAPAPDLAALALSLDDLPAGATVGLESYVETDAVGAVTAFVRNFDVDLLVVGTSELVDLESSIVYFESDAAAQQAIDALRGRLTGPEAGEIVKGFLETGAGIEVSNVRGETLSPAEAEGTAVIARAEFDTEAGAAEGIFSFVRVGPFHNAIFLIAPAGKLQLEDAGPLVDAVDERLAQYVRTHPGPPTGPPPAPQPPAGPPDPDPTPIEPPAPAEPIA
jgi:hypothetical protein